MQQESTNKLHSIDGHQLLPILVGGIPPSEGHLAILQADQAAIGDSHSMCIAGQVLDDVFRTTEGAPDMHDPVPTAQLTNESVELGWIAEMFDGAEKAKLALVECGRQKGQEFTTEHAAEDFPGEEESLPTGNPTRLVGAYAAGGNHAMHVRVSQELLTPGMQDGEYANLGAQTARVCGEGEQGLGDGAKQNAVDGPGILKRQHR